MALVDEGVGFTKDKLCTLQVKLLRSLANERELYFAKNN